MPKYAYDTEFLEDGKTIELISIGIVCEDGREYYAVNSDAPWDRIKEHDWLCKNVVPSLPLVRGVTPSLRPNQWRFSIDHRSTSVKPKWVIANEVREFLVGSLYPAGELDGQPFYLDTDLPELWADYGAYDHVVLAQLWGPMIRRPEGIPMFTHDIEQAREGVPGFVKPEQAEGQHNALEDARHNMRVLEALEAVRDA